MPTCYPQEPATGVEHLFATYMVWPHVVVELYPNGSAIHRWALCSLGAIREQPGQSKGGQTCKET